MMEALRLYQAIRIMRMMDVTDIILAA